MGAAKRWWGRVAAWARNPRGRAVRSVLLEVGVVLLVLAGMWAYTAQPFPGALPLVVVESESMMHGPRGPCLLGDACSRYGSPAFGRVGPIDPGDLVMVKRVDRFEEVETAFGAGSRGGFGGHGDVLVYRRDAGGSPIIHRAMLLVMAEPEGCEPNAAARPCKYVIPETCHAGTFQSFVRPRTGASNWRAYCQGSSQPITLDLEREGLFVSLDAYPCGNQRCGAFNSGFVTKGDNNRHEDQPVPYGSPEGVTCCTVGLDRIVGKARGEIPWFGLVKLLAVGNRQYHPELDPAGATQWRIGAATAPADLWVAFVLAVVLFLGAPVALDAGARWLGRRRRHERRKEEPSPTPARPEPGPSGPSTRSRGRPRSRRR